MFLFLLFLILFQFYFNGACNFKVFFSSTQNYIVKHIFKKEIQVKLFCILYDKEKKSLSLCYGVIKAEI